MLLKNSKAQYVKEIFLARLYNQNLNYQNFSTSILNERQIKILNRLLDVGYGNFEGGINTRKYASLATVSKPTASRELKDLVEKRVFGSKRRDFWTECFL